MKTTKTAISIPVDILEAAKQAADARQVSFSAFVSSAIRQALESPMYDEAGIPPSSILDDDLEAIRERLTRLEGMMIVIPEVIPEAAPVHQALLSIPHEEEKPAEVIPEVIPLPEVVIPSVIPEVIPSTKRSGGKRTGAIPVTEEMREELINQFDGLNDSGMKDSQIALTAGVSKSTISNIRKSKHKTLMPEEYEALKAVRPITS